MQFDLVTFVLEILNFLVLLWILWRFLWRPLQAALHAREQAQAAAEAARVERMQALDQRAQALDQAEQEADALRARERQALVEELAALRERRLAEVERELAGEREKALQRLHRTLTEREAGAAQGLRQQASSFVAGYLQRLAGPALETALIDLFIADLQALDAAAREGLRRGQGDATAVPVRFATAFAQGEATRDRLASALATALGGRIEPDWVLDPEVVCGLSVQLPGHHLETSLRAGVAAFLADAE